MKKYVFDSYALLAYCEGEESGKTVLEILKKAVLNEAEIFVCVVNWGEMYYIALREGGEEISEAYKNMIEKYPITIIDANKELTIQAARFKAFYKLSYADAYAAALAKIKNAVLVTGDNEFKPLEKQIKKILWI